MSSLFGINSVCISLCCWASLSVLCCWGSRDHQGGITAMTWHVLLPKACLTPRSRAGQVHDTRMQDVLMVATLTPVSIHRRNLEYCRRLFPLPIPLFTNGTKLGDSSAEEVTGREGEVGEAPEHSRWCPSVSQLVKKKVRSTGPGIKISTNVSGRRMGRRDS